MSGTRTGTGKVGKFDAGEEPEVRLRQASGERTTPFGKQSIFPPQKPSCTTVRVCPALSAARPGPIPGPEPGLVVRQSDGRGRSGFSQTGCEADDRFRRAQRSLSDDNRPNGADPPGTCTDRGGPFSPTRTPYGAASGTTADWFGGAKACIRRASGKSRTGGGSACVIESGFAGCPRGTDG